MAPEKANVSHVTCLNCRKRHSKCSWPQRMEDVRNNKAEPSCDKCLTLGERCILRRSTRFRNHSNEYDFSRHKSWIDILGPISFVDETADLHALYNGPDSSSIISQQGAIGRGWPIEPPQWALKRDATSDGSARQPSAEKLAFRQFRDEVPERNALRLEPRHFSDLPPDSTLGLYRESGLYDGHCFPLRNNQEVRLFKYYLEYMCTWFDLCDASRHFALEVPRRAMRSPTLLNAIFALSSRHLSMHQDFDEYASTRYHQNCLRQLSSVSSNSSALQNDDLLAATILLRTLEELDVPLLGTDHESHLLGIQVFMNAVDSSSVASELRKAAFWIGLRQEVTMASASQRSVKISLNHGFIDQSFTEGSDGLWANRIIVHSAKVLEFCFGDGNQSSTDYQALRDYDEGWLRSRPASFLPVAYAPADSSCGNQFPEITYMNDAVVIGVAHAALARALLQCYDPTLPKLGVARMLAQQRQEGIVQEEIRQLCGIALSNRGTIPATFTASLGIALCGDRFSRDEERVALLDLLVLTERDHFWPTASAQISLKRAWGWQ